MTEPRVDPAPARLVVLVSGSGTLLQALLDACAEPSYGAQVVAVGADRPGTVGEQRALRAGLPTFVCRVADHPDRKVIQRKGPTMNLTVAEYDQAIADQRKQAAIGLKVTGVAFGSGRRMPIAQGWKSP